MISFTNFHCLPGRRPQSHLNISSSKNLFWNVREICQWEIKSSKVLLFFQLNTIYMKPPIEALYSRMNQYFMCLLKEYAHNFYVRFEIGLAEIITRGSCPPIAFCDFIGLVVLLFPKKVCVNPDNKSNTSFKLNNCGSWILQSVRFSCNVHFRH